MADLTITRLKMGDAIPEWLLVCEPETPGAQRGNFRFDVDVDVIETPNYLIIFPAFQFGVVQHFKVIDDSGTMNHFVYAPAKPVHIISQSGVILPIEHRPQVEAWHAQQREAARVIKETVPDGGYVVPPEANTQLSQQVRRRWLVKKNEFDLRDVALGMGIGIFILALLAFSFYASQ